MKADELIQTLELKGFSEQEKDSGTYLSKVMGHVKLICYVEPEVEVEFITLYRWNNNDVKGRYNISMKDLRNTRKTVPELFRMTKEDLPRQIGVCVDTHEEVDKVIDYFFE